MGCPLTRAATTADPDSDTDQLLLETQLPDEIRGRPSTFSSLHTRNFRLFASGQVVSNTGTWMQRIAQDWLVLSLTGSATAVGITTALQFVPTLMFGLTGGLLADRYPKRRILLATQVGMATMGATLAARRSPAACRYGTFSSLHSDSGWSQRWTIRRVSRS